MSKEEKKNAILQIDKGADVNSKEMVMYRVIKDYHIIKTVLKQYEEKEKMLKDKIKEYNFDKLSIINNHDGSTLEMNITQFERAHNKFDKDKFKKLIIEVFDEETTKEIFKLMEEATENSLIKSVKISIKERDHVK